MSFGIQRCQRLVVALGFICLLLSSCDKSKDQALKDLAGLNLKFTPDDFVRAAAEGDKKALLLFFSAGIDVNALNAGGITALIAACERGKTDLVKELLDHRANPNTAGRDGTTPLIAAASTNQAEIIKLLLGRNADTAQQDNSGWTPLLKAVYQGNTASVQLLAEKSKSELDRGLLIAARLGHQEIVKILISSGAEVDTRAEDGRTALILAAGEGHKEIVSILLAAGADPTLTDQNGQTAEQVATSKGFAAIAETIRTTKPGAKRSPTAVAQNSPANPGATPAHPSPATGQVSPSSSAISDKDFLNLPPPNAGGSSNKVVAGDGARAGSLANKVSLVEVQAAILPITLEDVHGKRALLKTAEGSSYTVSVGDEVQSLGYRVVDVQARNVNDKDGNPVDASFVKLRHLHNGQTISLIKGLPAREHGAAVVLEFKPGGETHRVELDHDFTLPSEPGHTYRVLDIRPSQVVIKRMEDGEVWTLQKST